MVGHLELLRLHLKFIRLELQILQLAIPLHDLVKVSLHDVCHLLHLHLGLLNLLHLLDVSLPGGLVSYYESHQRTILKKYLSYTI